MGFDWIWFLSVWQTGSAGRARLPHRIPNGARVPGDAAGPARGGHRRLGLRDHRLHGALQASAVTRRWPGCASGFGARTAADARLCPEPHGARSSLGREHPSTTSRAPRSTWRELPAITRGSKRKGGDLLLAYGRDPYFAGWPDTLQLNYANPATQEAMIGELDRDRRPVRRRALRHGHAGLARRLRADLGPSGADRSGRATAGVRERARLLFMAEVYWDLEWTMQQQGFDYAYDKRLYDRLRGGQRARCASTVAPGSTTRTSWPAS